MIYLDNAATTALDSAILEKMLPYLHGEYGNASSVHTFGRAARMALERARQQVADLLGGQQKEIVFTSSATEANNLAIKGVVEQVRLEAFKGSFGSELQSEPLVEIVASPIEHPCVLETLQHLASLGWVKIVWLEVDHSGRVASEAVARAITERTILVSVMYVNNEIGTVMPIKAIGELVRITRSHRSKVDNLLPLYFHCDAVQAVQYFNCDVNDLGVDLLSLTAHKLYGPKGVGVLFVRDGVKLVRQIDGGGQEYYQRAGTENVAGIVGAGEAMSWIAKMRDSESIRLLALQQIMVESILNSSDKVGVTGSLDMPTGRAPHITSFFFEETDAEALIIALDRGGFAVSSGSACSSGVVRQSHVIQALGLPDAVLKRGAAVRVSTGRHTSEADIAAFVTALPDIVKSVRAMSFN